MGRDFAFALKNVDFNHGLAIGRGGEDPGLGYGNLRVAFDKLVNTPPTVSIPKDSEVTSRSTMSLTSPESTAP